MSATKVWVPCVGVGLLVAIAAIMASCQMETPVKTTQSLRESMRYFQDAQTGLCFASLGSDTYAGHVSISITNVPCTDKVLALVGK